MPKPDTALSAELTNARLALNDWHDCSSPDELNRWRAAIQRVIDAALGDRTKAILRATVIGHEAGVAHERAERGSETCATCRHWQSSPGWMLRCDMGVKTRGGEPNEVFGCTLHEPRTEETP